MEFGKSDWITFDEGIRKEWLLTNGIGGFASSTIIGANTRRYHGLLTASLKPPVQRHLILSKIDESIEIGDRSFNLYAFKSSDYTMDGFRYLQRFAMDPLPEFTYSVEDVFISKKISMVYGKNTVAIIYQIINGADSIKLKLTPLVNFRDYHNNSSKNHMIFSANENSSGVVIIPYNLDVKINICCNSGRFVKQQDNWFIGMEYPIERERGLHSVEDHYIPGCFEVNIPPLVEMSITVIATIENDVKCVDGASIIEQEKERIRGVEELAGYSDSFALQLVRAADNFIVYRKSTQAKTVIAGYPWFTDWGRDTMIALPGLTLVTGRFDDARQILYTFSRYVKDGLIPNMFPDEGRQPAYNSVDAALWYIEAVNKFLMYTKDYEFVENNLFESIQDIIQSFINGTSFNIHMDADNLIVAGDEKTQLTWMDAKVGEWVVTPRQGKAVEINALWYNAIRVMEQLTGKLGMDKSFYSCLAEKIRNSFFTCFWYEEEQYLYDVVSEERRDKRVRPNQILAVSLSNAVLDIEHARKVIQRVWKELYTPYGMRSLSPYFSEYRGKYCGDQVSRDGAYHQGTVWTWLMGHFITAYVKAFGNTQAGRNTALLFIKPFKDHMRSGGIGSISEIFDGDDPYMPRGCFAQAWSVAEILRAYVEDLGAKGV